METVNRSIVLATTNESKAIGVFQATLGTAQRLADPVFDIVFMRDTIPHDPRLLSLSRDYRTEVRHTRLTVDDPKRAHPDAIPGVAPASTYAGSPSCRSCHPTAYAAWEKSGHAHAFATLLQRDSDADPGCLACHTVGFGKPSGYQRPILGKTLTDVGCESCHGPAAGHVQEMALDGRARFRFRPLGAADCRTCHYGEFSRPFDWDAFWPLIQHGKEPRPTPPATPAMPTSPAALPAQGIHPELGSGSAGS